jgi:mono/diheme cytochrome c family protein
MPAVMSRRVILAILALVAAGVLAACGSRGISVQDSADIESGAKLFAQRCSGCHTLDVAGTEGGALLVNDRERTDGPNFNVRKEQRDQVLYAIRNGGYSGAIMPENIVVGKAAEDVAAFLAKYSGRGGQQASPVESEGGPPGSQTPESQSEDDSPAP